MCRELLPFGPKRLVVSSLRREEAESAVARLREDPRAGRLEIVPAWGDILLRTEWQSAPPGQHPRTAVLADRSTRRRLAADILDELNEEILTSSLLYQLILGQATGASPGEAKGKAGPPADIVVDCVNTATAVAYQNIFQTGRDLLGRIDSGQPTDWPEEVLRLLASLATPNLVRHMQILYEAMRRAKTQAYVKVGTSGTGGMGFNIPYTHGEERPSRLVLSKSAVAGAQTLLIFLLARTPDAPPVVKEIKPTAAIAWKSIGFGPITRGGRPILLFDCLPEKAYPLHDPATLVPEGDFGQATGAPLESVYIDTGENGLFAAGEFAALTTIGQMSFVTPEEIAQVVVTEIRGGNTGRDVIGALDGAVMGPSYRAGVMRQAALQRLRQLEAEHGVDSLAFEILGPPRLSKLLFEAYILRHVAGSLSGALAMGADQLAAAAAAEIGANARLRQHILSVGIPILLPSGDRLLRGPTIKATETEHGWVDLRPENMTRWQERLAALRAGLQTGRGEDTSSRLDRAYPSLVDWSSSDAFDVGEVVGWLFNTEDKGRRGKS